MEQREFVPLFNKIFESQGDYKRAIISDFEINKDKGWRYYEYLEKAVIDSERFVNTNINDDILKFCQEKKNEEKQKQEDHEKRQGYKDTIDDLTIDDLRSSRKRSNWALGISGAAILVSILIPFIESKLNGQKQVEVKVLIDTMRYKNLVDSLHKNQQSDSLSFYKIESYVDSLQRRIDTLEAHEKRK